jgi:hypothetical protein
MIAEGQVQVILVVSADFKFKLTGGSHVRMRTLNLKILKAY